MSLHNIGFAFVVVPPKKFIIIAFCTSVALLMKSESESRGISRPSGLHVMEILKGVPPCDACQLSSRACQWREGLEPSEISTSVMPSVLGCPPIVLIVRILRSVEAPDARASQLVQLAPNSRRSTCPYLKISRAGLTRHALRDEDSLCGANIAITLCVSPKEQGIRHSLMLVFYLSILVAYK